MSVSCLLKLFIVIKLLSVVVVVGIILLLYVE